MPGGQEQEALELGRRPGAAGRRRHHGVARPHPTVEYADARRGAYQLHVAVVHLGAEEKTYIIRSGHIRTTGFVALIVAIAPPPAPIQQTTSAFYFQWGELHALGGASTIQVDEAKPPQLG